MWDWIKKTVEKTLVNMVLTAYWYYNYSMVKLEMLFGLETKKYIKAEPELPLWLCVCSLENNKLLELYSYDESGFRIVHGNLCVYKEEKRYLCVSEYGQNADIAGTPNNTRFLNVQYVHPMMKSPIKLTLDIKYIRNGNEVFSKIFVCRLLEQQYKANDYVFDDKYEIHLMDHSVNKVVIKSNQYMKFDDLSNKSGYSILVS